MDQRVAMLLDGCVAYVEIIDQQIQCWSGSQCAHNRTSLPYVLPIYWTCAGNDCFSGVAPYGCAISLRSPRDHTHLDSLVELQSNETLSYQRVGFATLWPD